VNPGFYLDPVFIYDDPLTMITVADELLMILVTMITDVVMNMIVVKEAHALKRTLPPTYGCLDL